MAHFAVGLSEFVALDASCNGVSESHPSEMDLLLLAGYSPRQVSKMLDIKRTVVVRRSEELRGQ